MDTKTVTINEKKYQAVESLLPHQIIGLSFTATGYGARIPTSYVVKYEKKSRRIYCFIYSNTGTCFIGKNLQHGLIVS